MDELLDLIESHPGAVTFSIVRSDKSNAFSVTIRFILRKPHEGLPVEKSITRRVWPAAGVDAALRIMVPKVWQELAQ